MAASKAKAKSNRILGGHDRAQEEFDRIEGINFESRTVRMLHYRLECIASDKLKN